MYASQIDLSENVRSATIALLQARLSDALDLEAQLKQAHWNVKGRDFQQLHELFDEVHKEVEAFADVLAERITALGGIADGRVATTAAASRLDPYPFDAHAGEHHLRAVATALAQFAKSVRADIEAAVGLGEAVAADIFTELSRASDKQLWFIESHLL